MNAHLNKAANFILLLLGMESLCILIRDSFSLLLPPETFLWLALICLFLWLSASFRHGILIGMPLNAGILYYLYHYRCENLLTEFQDILEHINAAYYSHYSESNAALNWQSVVNSHMTAVLFLFFLLSAFIAVTLTSGGFRVSLSVLATIPLFAVCIAINGVPSVAPVIGMLLFWCGVQIGGEVFRPNDGAGKALFITLIPCLLILAALLLLYRPSNYVPSDADYSLSQRFDKLGNTLSEWLSQEGNVQETLSETLSGIMTEKSPQQNRAPRGWDRGNNELDLTAPFDRSVLWEEAFRVSSDRSGSLYLRGRSFGEYTGTAWTEPVNNDRGQALSYTAQTLASDPTALQGQFSLQSKRSYDVLYLPYFSISAGGSDISIPAEGRSSYGGNFYLSSTDISTLGEWTSVPFALQAEEQQYREFVHTYYTRLPSTTSSVLAQICQENGFSKDKESIIWLVADYVRRSGIYDLDVFPYEGSDFAVSFFRDSGRGYCIHFATAAAALYRCLGIPARICEGYLVNIQADQTVRVTGSDAHAWVEVYIDRIGWIPVEVTAFAAESAQQPSAGSIAPTPQVLPTPVSDEPQSMDSVDDSDGQDNTDSVGSGSSSSSQNKASSLLKAVARCICIITCVAAFLMGHYTLLRKSISRKLNDADGRKQAINTYRQAERILHYGGQMPAVLRETAEKARFSQHQIMPDELNNCADALNHLTEEVYSSLSKSKKILFRFWSGNL